MPLVKTLNILKNASLEKYAVGAFDVNSLDQPHAIIEKAEELKSPILMVLPGVIEPYVDFCDLAAVTMRCAQKASIPVGIHLSHGMSLDAVERALKAGFTSVMFDGSKLEYEENIKQTSEAVKMGHAFGAAVEGELGALGSSFANISESMTDPGLAKDYVKRTGADILAVAIGNAHGFYKGKPSLDFQRLEQIYYSLASMEVYLTLHGGSGIPADHMKRAIANGICKICIYTEMCVEGKKDAVNYCNQKPEYQGNFDIPELIKSINSGFCRAEELYIDMFGSRGKARSSDVWQLAKAKDYKVQPSECAAGTNCKQCDNNDAGFYWNRNV